MKVILKFFEVSHFCEFLIADPSDAAKEVTNESGNTTRLQESENLPSHPRPTADSFSYAKTLSEAVFAAFRPSPDRALQRSPSNTPNQTVDLAATPTKASTLPMTPPTGSPSRSIPEIIVRILWFLHILFRNCILSGTSFCHIEV